MVVGGGHECGQLAGGVGTGGETGIDGAEGERHVAPVAALLGVGLMDGQELEHADAERGETRQLLDQRAERARRGAPRKACAPVDMNLVDDGRSRRVP